MLVLVMSVLMVYMMLCTNKSFFVVACFFFFFWFRLWSKRKMKKIMPVIYYIHIFILWASWCSLINALLNNSQNPDHFDYFTEQCCDFWAVVSVSTTACRGCRFGDCLGNEILFMDNSVYPEIFVFNAGRNYYFLVFQKSFVSCWLLLLLS